MSDAVAIFFTPTQPKPVTRDSNSQQPDEQRALDEGIDYFSAQGALDRWRALNAEGRVE
jgi:hypothetical protein